MSSTAACKSVVRLPEGRRAAHRRRPGRGLPACRRRRRERVRGLRRSRRSWSSRSRSRMTRSDAISSAASSQNCSFASCLRRLVVAGDERQACDAASRPVNRNDVRFIMACTPCFCYRALAATGVAAIAASNVAGRSSRNDRSRLRRNLLRGRRHAGRAARPSCHPGVSWAPVAAEPRAFAHAEHGYVVLLEELLDALLPRLAHVRRRRIGIDVVRVDLERDETERLERRAARRSACRSSCAVSGTPCSSRRSSPCTRVRRLATRRRTTSIRSSS